MAKIKSKTLPVQIDRTTYMAAKDYAKKSGIPICRVIQRAVADWMATTGAHRMQVLSGGKDVKVR